MDGPISAEVISLEAPKMVGRSIKGENFIVKVYKGNIIFTEQSNSFNVVENGYVVVEDGKVKKVLNKLSDKLSEEFKDCEVLDYGDKLIIPGFIDLHFHAPQFSNIGLGIDKELLPWLTDYTFPEEAKFSDLDYAKKVFSRVAREIWRHGTTRVVLFSSLHKEATKLLMEIFDKAGLGAYVGKVNMDRNSPDFLIEDTKKSLEDTEQIIKEYRNKYELVKPIITPRFVPNCTPELMKGLSLLSEKYNVPIQSHLSENKDEVEWVKTLHSTCKDYASVYYEFGLLRSETIMAHCIYNTYDEIKLMKEAGSFAAHCPNANYNLSSGIMPVRNFMEMGVNLGLGTDVGAGHKLSITNVMSAAVQASKMKWLESNKKLDYLTTAEVFYLGTKGGGKFFGKVGSFEEGYDFDALIIDDSNLGEKEDRTIEERLQRFIYVGDDRNIIERYVRGNKVEEPTFQQ